MTQGQYPSITRGLGNLTPDLWRRLMISLAAFENNNRDETSKKTSVGGKKFFLAKITKSKRVADNQYIYAWTKVTKDAGAYYDYTDTTTTSTVDGDEWVFAATNTLEAGNTASDTSTGVNESALSFPAGYTMQAIGGGSDAENDPIVEYTVVIMWKFTDEAGVINYVFNAANSYDGSCSS